MLLLEHSADVTAHDQRGGTALWMKSKSAYEAVVKVLLEKDADFDVPKKYGNTALQMARLLLENDADVNADDEYGITAHRMASWNGNEAVVGLSLDNGADDNAYNKRRAVMKNATRSPDQLEALGLTLRCNFNRFVYLFHYHHHHLSFLPCTVVALAGSTPSSVDASQPPPSASLPFPSSGTRR